MNTETQSVPAEAGKLGRRSAGAVAGAVIALAAWGAGELAAGVMGVSSPLVAVGDAVVDFSPSWMKEAAIAAFGVYDKIVLIAGMAVVLVGAALLLGATALRRPAAGFAAIGVLAVVGMVAVVARRGDESVGVVPVVAAAAGAAAALAVMVWAARRESGQGPANGPSPVGPVAGEGSPSGGPAPGRRGFLLTGAAVAAGGAVLGGAGMYLGRGAAAGDARSALTLPKADRPLPPLPDGVDFDISGLSPFTTPNKEFYRIDTALSVPRLTPRDWTLAIDGMVDEPIELDYEALLRLPLVEADITMACVSNTVGGDLVGNSRWLGVRLGDLLREAGVQSGADQILSRSVDGWTCGTPTELVMDGRDAILAIAMNGEALPFKHGFPVRMVTPGIYGFVGSTKWLERITLTRFADQTAYWADRGWAVKAPIKTMSRIDVPGPLDTVPAGTTTVAGVAWAQHRGVDAVEVAVDGGDWTEAELAEVPGIDTWCQWRADVDLDSGRHTLRVRATDKTGTTQTEDRAEPVPNGASGWHSVQVVAE